LALYKSLTYLLSNLPLQERLRLRLSSLTVWSG